MNYEEKLFEIASEETIEFMQVVKFLNNGSFLRSRKKWFLCDIKDGESIYEHTCKLALASNYLLNSTKAVDLAVLHILVKRENDYLPDEINDEKKHCDDFFEKVLLKKKIPNNFYWINLWNQYEEEKALSFHINELVKICPAICALEYMKSYNYSSLNDFYPYAKSKLRTPQLIQILDEMYNEKFPLNNNFYEIYYDKLSKIRLELLI